LPEYGNKDILIIAVVTVLFVAALCGLILMVFRNLDKDEKDK